MENVYPKLKSFCQQQGFEFQVCYCHLQVKAQETHVIYYSKTSFEKNCFSAWASTLNMGLINKVDMVCLSPVGYGV